MRRQRFPERVRGRLRAPTDLSGAPPGIEAVLEQRIACATVHTDAPLRTHDGNGREALPPTDRAA